jgi:hypothetical protein
MHYYCDDGKIFNSKIEALKYSQKNNIKTYFYYDDDAWSKQDWKTEPPGTLEYHYLQQAKRLRDEYDYLILAYSGGHDSTNILETFYYNNIKLDKIITVGALSQDSMSGVDENHNGELYHNVFPYIKELGLESITEVYDYTKYFVKPDVLTITQYSDDWINYIGPWFSPHHWFWNDIERYVIPKSLGNKKVALIFGKDKPALFFNPNGNMVRLPTGNYMLNSFCFRDLPLAGYGNFLNKVSVSNCDRINFYWDHKYPYILIKQLHLLKQVYQIQKTNEYTQETGVQKLSGVNTDEIVYNLRKPILYKSPKSKTNYLSLRDSYLMNKTDSFVYTLYNAGISKLNFGVNKSAQSPISTKFYDLI